MKNLLISIAILALLVFLFSHYGVVETETQPSGGVPILQGDGIVIVGDGDLVVYEQSPATGWQNLLRLLEEGYTLWDVFCVQWRWW